MFPEPSSIAYFRFAASLILFLLICLPHSEASSSPLRPLKHVVEPSISLQLYPRTTQLHRKSIPSASIDDDALQNLTYSDSFRLTVSAYGETYHLHLKPNNQLLHPSARINYYTTNVNGEVVLDRTEPLVRTRVKAYLGDVIHPDHTDNRLQEDLVGGLLKSEHHPLGWARILVHDEGNPNLGIPPHLEGAFSVNGIPHHIMAKEKYMRMKNPQDPIPETQDGSLIIFRDSDITPTKGTLSFSLSASPEGLVDDLRQNAPEHDSHFCNHDRLEWNRNPSLNPVLRQPKQATWLDELVYGSSWTQVNPNMSVWRRDDIVGNNMDGNFESHIGQTAGCPVDPSVIYMGVAADCEYVQQHGSQENATMAILNNWNLASSLYKQTFNVNLAVIELSVHDSTCPTITDPAFPWNTACNTNITLNDRLSVFSEWRGTRSSDSAGLWHLMSGCPTGTEIGVAWLGTLCQTTTTGTFGQFVSGTAVTTAGRNEWQVVSHEIGHNLGAIHDCVSGCDSSTLCCPLSTSQCDSSSQFIMSPTSQSNEAAFSPCTVGNICTLTLLLFNCRYTKTLQVHSCNQKSPIQHVSYHLILKFTPYLYKCAETALLKETKNAIQDLEFNHVVVIQQRVNLMQERRAILLMVLVVLQNVNLRQALKFVGLHWILDVIFRKCVMGHRLLVRGIELNQMVGFIFSKRLPCGPNGQSCASGQCTSLALQCQTVGASLGLEFACPSKGDTSCQVSCQTPSVPSQCTILQAQLIDGSPCGFGGTCSDGRCASGSLIATVKKRKRKTKHASPQKAFSVEIVAAVDSWMGGTSPTSQQREFAYFTGNREVHPSSTLTAGLPRSQHARPRPQPLQPIQRQQALPRGPRPRPQSRFQSQSQSHLEPEPQPQSPRQFNVIQTVTYTDGSSVRSQSNSDTHSIYISTPSIRSNNNYSTGGPPTSYRRPPHINQRSESLYPSWVESVREHGGQQDGQERRGYQ
ncbi:hypothetical protein Clacol_003109 [Clathrus columnatus]|uniref:Peptidase M12B domain-containing protein n=1 Tax=Clathrus columnatus TaxID=1419009 RepID=A0AAV5A817_9AGAM|nr:hypothetical protein Clacol_003109 [Clathrus columnatus]